MPPEGLQAVFVFLCFHSKDGICALRPHKGTASDEAVLFLLIIGLLLLAVLERSYPGIAPEKLYED